MVAQQPGDPLAADVDIQAEAQLGMHARRAVGPTAVSVDLAELFAESGIDHGPLGRWPRGPGVVARARHTQHTGEPGDLVVCFLRVDQPVAAHR
jgi:hypothetical protein